jgi:hypothetical protein
MRRPRSPLLPGLVAVLTLMGSTLLIAGPVMAAPIAGAPTVYCADPGTDPSMDTGAGTMITCDTEITNTITDISSGGVPSGHAVVRVTECTGPASGRLDPSFLTCVTDSQNLQDLVTAVDQCNNVGYGGGNVLECSVTVSNEFEGVTPAAITAATVNQCNGSAPDTTGCDPFPASTTNATITQCNDSSYGGGQEDFDCNASGTRSATLEVTIHQCNDSNYGGGSWLTCSASVANDVTAGATPTPTPTASANATPSSGATPSNGTSTSRPRLTPPPTSTVDASASQSSDSSMAVVASLALLMALALFVATRRREEHRTH